MIGRGFIAIGVSDEKSTIWTTWSRLRTIYCVRWGTIIFSNNFLILFSVLKILKGKIFTARLLKNCSTVEKKICGAIGAASRFHWCLRCDSSAGLVLKVVYGMVCSYGKLLRYRPVRKFYGAQYTTPASLAYRKD